MSELVFLVHGFMRTGASMIPMAVGLRAAGYDVRLVTQINLHRDIPTLADDLWQRVERARDEVRISTGTAPRSMRFLRTAPLYSGPMRSGWNW